MKTISEYLDELPEPFKSKAIKNYTDFQSTLKTHGIKEPHTATSKHGALSCAFSWIKSPEGFDYWNDLYIELRSSKQ